MAIDLDSGDGLFDRLGRLIKLVQAVHDYVGGTSSGQLPYHVDRFVDTFTAGTNGERLTFEGIQSQLASQQSSGSSFVSSLYSYAANLVIEMAHADSPLPAKTIDEAIRELVAQMNDGSETVNASEPAASVAYGGSNDGNGVLVVSVVDGKGLKLQRSIAETVAVRFESATSATAYGQSADASSSDYNYPTGSGASISLPVAVLESAGVLVNGNLDSWTSSDPDSWTIGSGFAKETSVVRTTGGNSAKVASGTASMEQDITGTIEGQVPYLLSVGLKAAGALSSGVFKITITDGSSDLADEQAAAQALTVNFGSVTTSWLTFATIVQFADPLPATVKIKVAVTTGFDQILYVDDICFGEEAVQLYEDGPFAALASGTDEFGLDDTATIAVTNTKGAFQDYFTRMFPGTLLLPSATGAAETISDSLIA